MKAIFQWYTEKQRLQELENSMVQAELSFLKSQIQNLLPEAKFIRIHKSLIVAVSKIKSFNCEQVITERKKIPIGRRYRKDFLEQMETLKRGDF